MDRAADVLLLGDVDGQGGGRDIRVDGAHHAGLAVVARGLAAVEPDRGVAVDREREFDPRRRCRDRDGAAAESSTQGLARLVKRRLHHGVVLGMEDEVDDSPFRLDDVVGLKGKPVLPDVDSRLPHAAHRTSSRRLASGGSPCGVFVCRESVARFLPAR